MILIGSGAQMSRRSFAANVLAMGALGLAQAGDSRTSLVPKRRLAVIQAPSNLGLRPLTPGHEPGTWRAPTALAAAGLHQRLALHDLIVLPKPDYSFDEVAGTRIRNGVAIRDFSEQLAGHVTSTLGRGLFPLVVGGDCSILLGCLHGAGPMTGLVHIDGHSDFFHPGNYDTDARLGTAAGMDLALATGRGEPLLSRWGESNRVLVADAHTVQIGERDNLDPNYAYRDVEQTDIRRFDVREVLRIGPDEVARAAARHLADRGLQRVWLHVDLDVLDESVMPAVDSPGRPGLAFEQLSTLIRVLMAEAPIIGMDITIFDPELDPGGSYARQIVACMASALVPTANADG